MGLDEADEIGQLAAGGGGLSSIDGREHILELVVQGGLQATGEVEAVDQADQIARLGGRALDDHLEAAARAVTRGIGGRAVHRGGANGKGAAGAPGIADGQITGGVVRVAGGHGVAHARPTRTGGIDRDGTTR